MGSIILSSTYSRTYDRILESIPLFRSFSVPELVKTDGQIVVLTSIAAQYRAPFATEYFLSKHALNRLAELVVVGMFPLTLDWLSERRIDHHHVNFEQKTRVSGFSVSIQVSSRLNSLLRLRHPPLLRTRSRYPRRRFCI